MAYRAEDPDPPVPRPAGPVAAEVGAGHRRPEPRPSLAADLVPRLVAHLRDHGLATPGQTILVACSGGVDSTVLLHLLWRLRGPWNLRVAAAHLDHRMRPDSHRDAEWVAGLCLAWEIPLERGWAETPPRSETEARTVRYRFLDQAADRLGADRIATGHHADDQAETVLFRIARGTGIRGLRGIPVRRGRIIRPLLPFRRAEILAYAHASGLRYREDPTNRSPDVARNRIRHDILPRLEAVAPGAARALVGLAEEARRTEEAWDSVLDALEPSLLLEARPDAIVLARPPLLSYHPQVRGRMLRRLLHRLGSRPDRAGTRAAVEFITSGASGGHLRVAGGVRVEREFDRIVLRRPRREAPGAADRPVRIPAPGEGAGEALVGGRRVVVRWTLGDRTAEAGEAFDPAALQFPLELRGWRPGDRIRLPYGTKKLKKLFTEHRVGRAERARTPVLAEVEGRVLWVVPLARAALALPKRDRPRFRIAVMDAES